MKRYAAVLIIIIVAVILVLALQKLGVMSSMTAEDLDGAIEITDVRTSWVDKYYQPWPPRLILVPSISFRVKNKTTKPLRYINFNANFRFRDDYENLGDAFLAAIRSDPIPASGTSDPIHLKCNYGVEGKSLASFANSPHWKVVIVKLFAQSSGSQFLPLGEWEVSKKIDFKEPEPVGVKPDEQSGKLNKEDQ
ncbi:hypothetical protein ACFLT2_10195 [Acidobacteriota bacterium]